MPFFCNLVDRPRIYSILSVRLYICLIVYFFVFYIDIPEMVNEDE